MRCGAAENVTTSSRKMRRIKMTTNYLEDDEEDYGDNNLETEGRK